MKKEDKLLVVKIVSISGVCLAGVLAIKAMVPKLFN